MRVIREPEERRRFSKFLIVGVIGAAIDFGVANSLTHFASWSLTQAGSLSFLCAIASNFLWNRYWTYPDSRSRHVARQLIMFFGVNLAGIAIRIPVLHYTEPPIQAVISALPFYTPDTAVLLARNATLALAVGIVLLWNFFANRHWTYNDIS